MSDLIDGLHQYINCSIQKETDKMEHRDRKTDEVIVSYGSIHQLSEPDDEPPDSDGTAYDGVEQVSPRIWIGLAWAMGILVGTVTAVLLYLFCDLCRSIW